MYRSRALLKLFFTYCHKNKSFGEDRENEQPCTISLSITFFPSSCQDLSCKRVLLEVLLILYERPEEPDSLSWPAGMQSAHSKWVGNTV